MKKILVLTALLAVACASIQAAPVDPVAAEQAARLFLGEQVARGGHAAPTASASLQLVYAEPCSASVLQQPVYYIFDTEGGFVIVAGDDRAEAVLGYGDGHLEMSNLPCNLQWMLDHYKEQIEWLLAHEDAQVQRVSASSSTVIKPLMHCTWSQSEPYFNQCPVYKGAHCVTGCIATAMAQVMYYWRYPDELPNLPAYTARTYNIYVPALPGTVLDWDNMLDGYSLRYTPEQGDAVATLMRYCGQASSMEYGTDGSGSGCWNQMVGMNIFGYSLSAQLVHRDEYDADTWRAMMLEDLSDGYPILYSGYGEAGGHAFVVDGYDGYRFHINWGWEGYYNNYFMLDAFDVAGMSFSYNQEMQYRLYPPEYTGTHDFEVDGVCYKINGNEVAVTSRSPQCNSYQGSVTIPGQVTDGGITYKVTAIAYDAFRDCDKLTSVTLPSTIKHIGKYAFKNCSRLSSITLPSSVKTIDYGAFMYCSALTSLTLGNGVEDIGYYAFAGCMRLGRLSVPSSVASIGYAAFMDCTSLKTVAIADGTTVIDEGAFAYCYKLQDVTIGDGTEVIGGAAFYECRNLKNVTLGLMVDSIGPYAFKGCTSLSLLKAWPELPPLVAGEETFDSSNFTTATLAVREEMLENYICDDVWTRFVNIVAIEDEVIIGDVNGDSEVTIADVNALIDGIFGGEFTAVMDVNGDGEVNIADVNAIIDIILK